MENKKLRFEIGELRKNIEFMSKKLETIYMDNEKLMKNNDYGTMEKGQINEELQKMRSAYQKLY